MWENDLRWINTEGFLFFVLFCVGRTTPNMLRVGELLGLSSDTTPQKLNLIPG